ncbi:AAA family ATPase [Streptomyces sp. NBC_00306]
MRNWTLVERDAEQAALQSQLDTLAASAGGLTVVEGPAGIGKSRLLAEAPSMATRKRFRVLTAKGSVLEQGFAFGAVRQLLGARAAWCAARARRPVAVRFRSARKEPPGRA